MELPQNLVFCGSSFGYGKHRRCQYKEYALNFLLLGRDCWVLVEWFADTDTETEQMTTFGFPLLFTGVYCIILQVDK